MTVIGEAFVDVKPKTDNFAKDTEKGVSSGLGSVAKKVAIGFGAVLASGAAISFVGGFVKAAAESQKISRITDAVIKSTGAAAGLSATQVGDLATSLSNLTGIDDEVIQSASNILLTFTNIRDAAGIGNDIFSRTTEAALNMATVLGGDPTSAIQQLGKALNDPAEGLTKLSRSGVVFTESQKKMVEELQAAGDILGAQKVILDELDKEFGGAAAAAADPFDRLTVVMGNLKEAIGGALIPVLAPAAEALANLVAENQEGIAAGLTSALDGLASIVGFLRPGVENVAEAFGFLFEKLGPIAERIGEFVDDHLPSLRDALSENTPLMEAAATAVVALAGGFAAIGVASAALGPVAPLVGILGAMSEGLVELAIAVGVAAGPIALIAGAILAAVAAGEALYQFVGPVQEAFDSLFGDTLAPFAAALTFLNPFVPLAVGAKFLYDRLTPLQTALDAVVGFVTDLGGAVADAVGSIDLGGLGEALATAFGSIDLSGIGDAISRALGAASSAFSTIVVAVRAVLAPAIRFLTDVWDQYGDEVTAILEGFRDIAGAVFERVAGLVTVFATQIANVADVITNLVGPAFDFLAATVEIAISPLADIVAGALEGARIAFETFIGVVGPMWETLWSFVTDVVSNVVGPFRTIVEGFLQIIAGFVDVVAGVLTLDWSRAWEGIVSIAEAPLTIVQGIMGAFLGFLDAVWSNATDLLTLPFTTAWTVIQGVVEAGTVALQTALAGALSFLGSVWSNAGTLLSAPVEAGRALIEGIISGIVGLFSALPGQVTAALATLGSSIAGAIASAATTAVSAAGQLVSDVVGKIAELPGLVASALVGVASSVAGAIKDAVVGAINSVIDRFNDISDIDTPFGTIGLPDIGRLSFAIGGIVPGTQGQAVPVTAHGGELVLNDEQQSRLLFAIAQGRATLAGGASTYVDARFVNEGTIIGIDDLDARMEAHIERIGDVVAAGVK